MLRLETPGVAFCHQEFFGCSALEITVTIPDGVSTRVEAETVMGGISTDFPLTVSGRFGPRRITGTIQGDDSVGNRELHLRTVNGAIRLRSSS